MERHRCNSCGAWSRETDIYLKSGLCDTCFKDDGLIKDNMVPKEYENEIKKQIKINRLLSDAADIQKVYNRLYNEPDFGLCGISSDYVQLTSETFIEIFGLGEDVKEVVDGEQKTLNKLYQGTKFICLVK